jgi:hypothetical protein
MQSEIVRHIAEYLRQQPFTNVLILLLLGAIIWARLENTKQLNRMSDGFAAAIAEIERKDRDDKRVLIWALTKENFDDVEAQAKKAGALDGPPRAGSGAGASR